MSNSQYYFIASDPDQTKCGFYRLIKTNNLQTALAQLNTSRANRDWKIIHSWPVHDLRKAETLIKTGLQSKFINNSNEWIKSDEAGLSKIITTITHLIEIANDVN